MNFLLKNDKKKGKFWLVILLIFLVFLLLIYSKAIPLAGFLHYGGTPLWKFRSFMSEKSFFLVGLWKSRLSISQENLRLKEELEKTNLKIIDRDLLEEEIKNLKALLGREDLSKVVPAAVLSRPPQTAYDYLIIDAGRNFGLGGGEKVFFESVILGEVEEVFAKTSKVRAFSSRGETPGFIERSGLPITLLGRGGGNFESRLPHEALVEEGDFVVIPGIANRFVGQVEAIESNPTGSFKKIFLRYPLNLSSLRWVTVEVGNHEDFNSET